MLTRVEIDAGQVGELDGVDRRDQPAHGAVDSHLDAAARRSAAAAGDLRDLPPRDAARRAGGDPRRARFAPRRRRSSATARRAAALAEEFGVPWHFIGDGAGQRRRRAADRDLRRAGGRLHRAGPLHARAAAVELLEVRRRADHQSAPRPAAVVPRHAAVSRCLRRADAHLRRHVPLHRAGARRGQSDHQPIDASPCRRARRATRSSAAASRRTSRSAWSKACGASSTAKWCCTSTASWRCGSSPKSTDAIDALRSTRMRRLRLVDRLRRGGDRPPAAHAGPVPPRRRAAGGAGPRGAAHQRPSADVRSLPSAGLGGARGRRRSDAGEWEQVVVCEICRAADSRRAAGVHAQGDAVRGVPGRRRSRGDVRRAGLLPASAASIVELRVSRTRRRHAV